MCSSFFLLFLPSVTLSDFLLLREKERERERERGNQCSFSLSKWFFHTSFLPPLKSQSVTNACGLSWGLVWVRKRGEGGKEKDNAGINAVFIMMDRDQNFRGNNV